AAEKSADLPEFQRGQKLSCINTIIFNSIGIPDNLYILKPGYRSVHGILHIFRKRRGHTSNIHFIGMESLRLNKYLVPFFICEFYHLILNRRAVAGAGSLDRTGK